MIETSLKGTSITKTICPNDTMDEVSFLKDAKLTVYEILKLNRNTKIEMRLYCEMVKTNMNTGDDEAVKSSCWSENLGNVKQQICIKRQMENELGNYLGKGRGCLMAIEGSESPRSRDLFEQTIALQ